MQIDAFLSFTLAVVLLIVGKVLTMRFELLRKYSIPEPVVGGLLCAAAVAIVFWLSGRKITFELDVRNHLLLLFFGSIGLKSDIRTLVSGGRPLAVLLGLATIFILLQNVAGTGMAALFGLDPKAGLMVGSISLTGGVGTTLAWAPIFIERLGISNAMELGVAANTIGLIAACIIGGPTAAYLMRRHKVTPSHDIDLDIGAAYDRPQEKLDYFCILWAILALNTTIIIGLGLNEVIVMTGLTLPAFVSCLLAGILIRNLLPYAAGKAIRRFWPGIDDGLALLSDLALGLFLTMALMGLQIWELSGVFVFISCALALQIALTVLYTIILVFPAMGRDYEAAVISAGFSGITLGSTATAIANMSAVTQQHGAAHRAFIVVPLVCGFFIDIVNALVISGFVG